MYDVDHRVEYEAMWGDEWRYNITIDSNHPQNHDVN